MLRTRQLFKIASQYRRIASAIPPAQEITGTETDHIKELISQTNPNVSHPLTSIEQFDPDNMSNKQALTPDSHSGDGEFAKRQKQKPEQKK
jgi:hypothetical protein